MKPLVPYFLILLGLFTLFFINQPIPAGIFLLVGIVMIFEQVWPEKWESKKKILEKQNVNDSSFEY